MRRKGTLAAVLAGLILAASCSRAPQSSSVRIAILPFENLTGDASLDWVASAAPDILAEQMVGSRDAVPMRAGNISEAYLAAAARFVHGYFTQLHGNLRFEIEVEDAARHKMIAADAMSGSVLEAMNRAAHQIDPSAQPFSTANADAVAAWARGDDQRATELDPDFGVAWIAWAESAAQKRSTAEAIDIAGRGLARQTLRSPIDRARLAVLSATLRQDQTDLQKSLAALHGLDPSDTSLAERLAEAESRIRNFTGAADLYKQILSGEPDNPAILLALGYAQALAGDLDSARKTFETYGNTPGQKTNSLDSLGEMDFVNGRFADAEKYFLEAHDSNPGFLAGVDLFKAAYAHWLAGDLQGADAIMARYLDFRRQTRDPLVSWREASWDYATGRRDLAMKKILDAPRPLAERQIAAWNAAPSTDLAALKVAYERAAPSSDGLARTLYAAALLRAGQKDEARKLIARWPLPSDTGPDALLESTVFPRFLELRRALQ